LHPIKHNAYFAYLHGSHLQSNVALTGGDGDQRSGIPVRVQGMVTQPISRRLTCLLLQVTNVFNVDHLQTINQRTEMCQRQLGCK